MKKELLIEPLPEPIAHVKRSVLPHGFERLGLGQTFYASRASECAWVAVAVVLIVLEFLLLIRHSDAPSRRRHHVSFE